MTPDKSQQITATTGCGWYGANRHIVGITHHVSKTKQQQIIITRKKNADKKWNSITHRLVNGVDECMLCGRGAKKTIRSHNWSRVKACVRGESMCERSVTYDSARHPPIYQDLFLSNIWIYRMSEQSMHRIHQSNCICLDVIFIQWWHMQISSNFIFCLQK